MSRDIDTSKTNQIAPSCPEHLDKVVYEEGELFDQFKFEDEFGYVMSFSSPEAVVNALTYESTKKIARSDRYPCRRWHRTTVGMLQREINRHDYTL